MIRDRISRLLAINDTSERLALAFAVGVFLSFTPFVGFHTLLAFAFAFLFGLNRVAILIGILVNNPWTYVPYYAIAARLGGHLIGFPPYESLLEFRWAQLGDGAFWLQLLHHWRFLMPVAIGSTILAVLVALLSYPLALHAIRRGRAALKLVRVKETAA
jgi:uncharacterized protein (DUF2062 family)